MILIGPRGQAILAPYLLRPEETYCFSPRETVAEARTRKRASRRKPITPSEAARTPKKNPKRAPTERYSSHSYLQAVAVAMRRANAERSKGNQPPLPNWRPNQLRHSAATDIRRQFGLEAAQVILGHAKADVTQVYAERDMELAKEVVRKIG